ncbi:hypothetical protein [Frondihabitans peucedani]|uniref:Transposase n=1 Tax=Frondihabitans peucedani TaxID=598626 RepID=A0ABP8E208_9MICO
MTRPADDSAAGERLAEIARELYRGDPGSFVAARTRAAHAAESRDLAGRIAKLPKPAVAAHVVDALVGSGHEALDALTEVAGRLREAEEGGDATLLRSLSAERRRAVADATEAAVAAAAEESGASVSASVQDAVAATFQAAVVDPASARAVASGLLVKPLSPGADPVEALGVPIDLGVGADDADPSASGAGRGGRASGAKGAKPAAAARRARAEADTAEKKAAEAQHALEAAEDELTRIREERDEVGERLDELRDEVADLEERESGLGGELARAQRSRRDAAAAERSARSRAAELRRRAD